MRMILRISAYRPQFCAKLRAFPAANLARIDAQNYAQIGQ